MPRLVRRAPLGERIKAYLNPLDFLLWLSEEVDSNDWDEFHRSYSTPIGLILNFIFLIARANSGWGRGSGSGVDDVFSDEISRGGSGWLGWLASFIVHSLTLCSLLNALYTFRRRRHYRLFESPVDITPSTPSAHRVRVDSSPISSSPLRFLSSMIASTTAESRAHPDPSMDVWELSVWDPLPICLRIFCLFSPGHVLVYWLFLPTTAHDPRPSTTVLTTIILSGLLSIQLLMLQTHFSQQNKDTAMIHKEVLNEYDTKFVHPRTTSLVRDVGTQFDTDEVDKDLSEFVRRPPRKSPLRFVHTYTPTTIIHRGFQIHPNPNYAKHYDPEGITTGGGGGGTTGGNMSAKPRRTTGFQTPTYSTTTTGTGTTSAVATGEHSSPVRPRQSIRQPLFQQQQQGTSTGVASTGVSNNIQSGGSGDGGSLGIYSHANSPLKKHHHHHHRPSSTTGVGGGGLRVDYNQHQQQRRSKSPVKREGSPLKKSTTLLGGVNTIGQGIPQESSTRYGGYASGAVGSSSGVTSGGGGGMGGGRGAGVGVEEGATTAGDDRAGGIRKGYWNDDSLKDPPPPPPRQREREYYPSRYS
ncbi:MAG: hypothetical protein M1823_000026 [Watsoniomyces obsoletus]|nr:MAG: hypothetical protein M1823_000026 [Watsoniomyces obsoletus]